MKNKLNFQDFQMVLCTCPDYEMAEKLATLAVNDKLAACVNILPNITSIYRWQGKVEKTQEYLLIIKSQKNKYNQIEELIKINHPYQIPEIIASPIINGLVEYLTWIKENSET